MNFQEGVCRVCGEGWPLRTDGTVPEHNDPDPSHRTRLDVALGWTPRCAGSNEQAAAEVIL